jgi:hypothetical protein
MKIALCFSGQLRTGLQTAPNILRYIGDLLPECDFFIHTWDIESPPHAAKEQTPVDKTKFSEFHKIYNPIAMVVEPYNLRPMPEGGWGGERLDPKTNLKYISMFESIYEANRLKTLHEQKHNFTYDRVIRIRPDLVFSPDKTLRDDLILAPVANDTLVAAFHKGYGENKLEDIFWIGTSEAMDRTCAFNEIRAQSGRGASDDWQIHMADWLKNDQKIQIRNLENSKIKLLRKDQESLNTLTDYDNIPAP